MKIAICLSGFMRNWDFTKHSFIERLCESYDVDVFVDTYEQNYHEYSSGQEDVHLTQKDIVDALACIPAKMLRIEDRNKVLHHVIDVGEAYTHITGFGASMHESSGKGSDKLKIGYRIIDQMRKIEECNQLRLIYQERSGFVYDIVIRARFDMMYTTSLLIRYEDMVEGTIYTEDGSMGGFPRDGVVAGRSATMDMAFNTRFSKLPQLFLGDVVRGGPCVCGNIKPCCEMCAHSTIAHMCYMNNVKIQPGFIHGYIVRSPTSFAKSFTRHSHVEHPFSSLLLCDDKVTRKERLEKTYSATVQIQDLSMGERKLFMNAMFPKLVWSEDFVSDIPRIPRIPQLSSSTQTAPLSSTPALLGEKLPSMSTSSLCESATSCVVIVTSAKRGNYSQTLETLKSIRAKIPCAYIVLAEAREVNVYDINVLYEYVDKFVLFYNDVCAIPFLSHKSLGETYKLIQVLKHVRRSASIIFKISGRYVLNDKFKLDDFTNSSAVCAKIYNEAGDTEASHFNITKNEKSDYVCTNCMNTVMYSVPHTQRSTYESCLTMCLKEMWYNRSLDIEHALYNTLPKHIVHKVKHLGVQGVVGDVCQDVYEM
jgi:hypothetical protein